MPHLRQDLARPVPLPGSAHICTGTRPRLHRDSTTSAARLARVAAVVCDCSCWHRLGTAKPALVLPVALVRAEQHALPPCLALLCFAQVDDSGNKLDVVFFYSFEIKRKDASHTHGPIDQTAEVKIPTAPWQDAWQCRPQAYNAGDACDCECGLFDPDCLISGTPIKGCNPDEYCTIAGVCSVLALGLTEGTQNSPPKVMAVSVPCSPLYKPLESIPFGFSGDYKNTVGSACPACPEDIFYGKAAQLSKSTSAGVVCNYAPKGFLSSDAPPDVETDLHELLKEDLTSDEAKKSVERFKNEFRPEAYNAMAEKMRVYVTEGYSGFPFFPTPSASTDMVSSVKRLFNGSVPIVRIYLEGSDMTYDFALVGDTQPRCCTQSASLTCLLGSAFGAHVLFGARFGLRARLQLGGCRRFRYWRGFLHNEQEEVQACWARAPPADDAG